MASASRMTWTDMRDCSQGWELKADKTDKAPVSKDTIICWVLIEQKYIHLDSTFSPCGQSDLHLLPFSFFNSSFSYWYTHGFLRELCSSLSLNLYCSPLHLCQCLSTTSLAFMNTPNMYNLSLKAAPWHCGRKWVITHAWNLGWFRDNSVKISYFTPCPLTLAHAGSLPKADKMHT